MTNAARIAVVAVFWVPRERTRLGPHVFAAGGRTVSGALFTAFMLNGFNLHQIDPIIQA